MTAPTRALTPLLGLALLLTSACSLVGGDGGDGGDDPTDADGRPSRVVLVTHDTFVLPDEVKTAFEEESGYQLVVRPSGDAGTLTNKLVLTKDDPTGDVAYGVDNTFASRAVDAGVFAAYTPADVPAGVAAHDLPGDEDHVLTPVDDGNVCVNVDDTWFEQRGLAEPETLADLVEPAYRDLFVLPGAATSSTGLAFLLATIDEYGDGWPDYWKQLVANGAELTQDWESAYQVDFTQGGGKGTRPIVLSYDTSPAFTVADGTSTTHALLDTCFTQTEYVGVLDGADNVDGAEALVDFMLTPAVQAALPESMYVFPLVDGTPLPPDWARFAERPTDAYDVDPADITAHREEWLRTWSDVTSGGG